MTYKKAHQIVNRIRHVKAREFERDKWEIVCQKSGKVICR
jgi:hypothetical protein